MKDRLLFIHHSALRTHHFFSGYGVAQASESWALVAKVQLFLPGLNLQHVWVAGVASGTFALQAKGLGASPKHSTKSRASSSDRRERLPPKQEVAGLSPVWPIYNF